MIAGWADFEVDGPWDRVLQACGSEQQTASIDDGTKSQGDAAEKNLGWTVDKPLR